MPIPRTNNGAQDELSAAYNKKFQLLIEYETGYFD
jgi:hypothetical protein